MKPNQKFYLATCLSLIMTIVPAMAFSQAEALPTETSMLFSGSGNCAFCHTSNGVALTDSKGIDLSISTDWRATMMGNSARDPLWQAKVESEVMENPALKALIEDKCTTCHAPMGRTQAVHDGASGYSIEAMRTNALAMDGVSCTACHQIQPENLGTDASFSGKYQIEDTRQIFGPYQDVVPMPMMHHTGYTPQYGEHIHKSELCATCHTLFTPFVDDEGEIAGMFPEQTPYLEWQNSIFSQKEIHCQDCHMPRIDEAVKISSMPPWIGTQSPFWRHQFVGGNAFMLQIIRDNAAEIGATATAAQFDKTIAQTRMQLREKTASLNVQPSRKGGQLLLEVEIANRTGHKFPTGFPGRRAWLHVLVQNDNGEKIFESGAFDQNGRIQNLTSIFEPHYDFISSENQAQIYETVMTDVNDELTFTLLRAAKYKKDNRLPPRGFVSTAKRIADVAIHGAAAGDANFNRDDKNEGTGRDLVTYQIAVPATTKNLKFMVELLYQTAKPAFVDDLLMHDTPAVARFSKYFHGASKAPEVIAHMAGTL